MKNYSNNFIFCCVRTQYENLGDLVINKTLLSQLRNYGKLIVDTRGVPDWFCEELEISVDEQYSTGVGFYPLMLRFGLRVLVNSNSQVYLIINPGGFNGSGLTENWIGHIKSLVWFFVFRIIGIRICWFGASIKSFSRMREMFEKWKSNFMYFSSVRDSISQDYGTKIGIKRLASFPDLAWLMETPPASDEAVKVDGDYIIFSFRVPPSLADIVEYKNGLYTTLDTIVKLVCGDWSKKLVISYQVTFDYEFCKGIRDRYKDYCDVIFIERQIDSQCMYNLYSRAFMVFSDRLHVLLFAMVCGSLPVAVIDLAMHNKITGIFLDAGLMRLVIDRRKRLDEVEVLRGIANDADLIKGEIALYRKRQRTFGEELLRGVMNGAEYLPEAKMLN